MGTSLAVQWLRLCTSTAGGTVSVSGWGTKIPCAVRHSQNKEIKKLLPSGLHDFFGCAESLLLQGFYLVVESRGCSLVVTSRLLVAVAYSVVEHRLSSCDP